MRHAMTKAIPDPEKETCQWVSETQRRLKAWNDEYDKVRKLRDGPFEEIDMGRLMKLPDRPKTVRVDPEHEYVDLAAYPHAPYSIALERIDTTDKLVRWLHHLSGKIWFDEHMQRDLIMAWAKHFRDGSRWVHLGL